MALPRIPPRLVVELSRPTILNLAAIICYCLAMMFHVIAYTTDNWSILKLDGVEWRMGLWYGCRHNTTDDTWHCSTDVYNDKVFKTGSNWHVGSQIMMTFALIILFLLEFAVIGYACIKRLERHKDRVVGVVIALSVTAAFCHFLVLILYGSAVGMIKNFNIKASFGIIVISMFLEVAIAVLTFIDKRMQMLKEGAQNQQQHNDIPKSSGKHKLSLKRKVSSLEAEKKFEPQKLSASELAERFPPYEFDNLGYYPPVSMCTSTSSLTNGRTNSIGSAHSLQTQSTVVTGLSYEPDPKYSDRSSMESLV